MNNNVSTPRFADVQLTTGVRLRYAEQGDPAGQPIILLHGYTDSWYSFSRVLPALAANYHVYALDQRGHGDSDRPERGYSMPDFAADVVAFMDALDLPCATLAGHSMGSFVAQQVALAAPERVPRLILVGAATNLRTKDWFELQQVVDTLADPLPVEFAREFQTSTIFWPVPDVFLDQVVVECLKLPTRLWRAVLAGMLAVDYTADLGRIQAPTLILRGDQDAVFSRAAQDSLANGIARAVLKVYPETGHSIHWERPEQVVEDMKDFISLGVNVEMIETGS